MTARRLKRSAAALGDIGRDILDWLDQLAQRAALVRAAEDGLPSVAGISEAFVARFGKDAGKTMILRQFVGRAVRQIMAEEGFTPVDTGVKLPGDAVFSSGTRYMRSDDARDNPALTGLLPRLLAVLSASELRQVEEFIKRRRHAEPEERQA
jgi:hypothetical protein